jgi:putative transposase
LASCQRGRGGNGRDIRFRGRQRSNIDGRFARPAFLMKCASCAAHFAQIARLFFTELDAVSDSLLDRAQAVIADQAAAARGLRRSAANRHLIDDIRRVHRDTHGRYGSPRIHVELKAQGRGVSRGRIERLMRHHGIRVIMAQPRRVRTTDSRHDFPIAPNLLDRNFTAAAPNRIWLADITYIETDQGWLYLATVLDLYSRRIVGWAMQDHLRADPPLAALKMAISAQRPDPGLIHHSDRGVQYPSAEYRKAMQSAGFEASMSRKGDCYDNAPMESFFHTLKTELVHHRQYATRAEAKCDIFAYIEGFYNRTRRHSAIGYPA